MQLDLDVAIVGGGVAGTTLAAVMARRGTNVRLFDPHAIHPTDFKAEKLTAAQVATLARLGLADQVLAVATPLAAVDVAREGIVVERRPIREYGVDYAVLVNALRATLPAGTLHGARVASIAASGDRQALLLSDGTRVAARLAVVASGLGRALLTDLGIRRLEGVGEPRLAIGFDIATSAARGFTPLTYYGETPADRSAYLTLFPIGGRLRANLFVYRRHDDAWCRAFRADPVGCLLALMPGLRALLPDLAISGLPVLRPIHLHETQGHRRDGAVLIGDAFSTSCPTAGTGIGKALTDVERLTALVPGWLATPGMDVVKIARFYDDPVKRSHDRTAIRMNVYAQAMTLDASPVWRARRWRNLRVPQIRHWIRGRLHAARVAARMLALL